MIAIVNRSSGKYAAGLALDENNCGKASWSRVAGGYATLDGSTSGGTALPTNGTSQRLQYTGLQFGRDFNCFNGAVSGWDVATGGVFGLNMGKTEQTVSVYSAKSNATFNNYYGGVYLAATNGPWDLDLQFRAETTNLNYDFDFDTIVAGSESVSAGMGAQTLSAALRYTMPLAATGLTFAPTAGLSVTSTSASPLTFASGDTFQVQNHTGVTGFFGGTLAKTKVDANRKSATSQFIAAKVYNNFDDAWASTFATGATNVSLTTSGLGAFAELSAGFHHVKLLKQGQFGNARQLSTSLQAEARLSGDQTNIGVTAKASIEW